MTHNDLWRYDPLTDSWAQMMSIPGSTRRNAVGLTIGTKGYVGLGADSSVSWSGTILDDWWEYDPALNSWTQKSNYPGGIDANGIISPQGIYFATSFSIGSKGYVCGGKMGPDAYGTDLWEYDPALDSWTRMADFPGSDRYQHSSFSLEGMGYVGMGIDHDVYHKDWWKYDPVLDSWTQVSSLPGVERGAASTFVISQRGYVVFGSDGGFKDELWEYNPFSDSWNIKANFPADGRKNGIAFSIGDKGYAGIGKGSSGKRRSFYEYSPLHPIGIIEQQDSYVHVYPNPIQDQSTIQLNTNFINSYVIVDLKGREILSESINHKSIVLNRDQFETGTYLLILKSENDKVLSTEKLIFI